MSFSSAGIGYNQNVELYSKIQLLNYQTKATSQRWAASESASTRVNAENFSRRQVNSSRTLLSHQANAALLQQQEMDGSGSSAKTPVMNSSKGDVKLNLDDYFSNNPATPTGEKNLLSIPLLLPTANNINAISQHASERFQQMLSDYNIPFAPGEISYDNHGQMQLPNDYPYAAELKQALQDNPGLDRELHSVNALTSHYVEMQKSLQFSEEYTKARSSAEANAILAKYSFLFQDNREYSDIALSFSKEGNLTPMTDGKPTQLT